MTIGAEILLILLLLLANGLFAMSEIALVSSRRARLQQRADAGDAGARRALQLAAAPSRFLSTVQVGITLVGIFAGAFGGATLAGQLAALLAQMPALAPYAEEIGLVIVVGAITYASLIIGELVPKRVALAHPERIAALMARPMTLLSRAASPLVTALEASSNAVLAVLRAPPAADATITQDEITLLIRQAAQDGVLLPSEQDILERAFRLADYRASSVMTPRPDIVWLDLADTPERIREKTARGRHARYPVADGSLDRVVGIVDVRDLWTAAGRGEALQLAPHLRKPLVVPETTTLLALIEQFRSSGLHIALLLDEYGGVEGLVTINDILEALVGALPAAGEQPAIVARADGSMLVDGAATLDELRTALGVEESAWEGDYNTVGGLVLTAFGRIPAAGQRVTLPGLLVEVVDMDGHRVDKVLVTRQ